MNPTLDKLKHVLLQRGISLEEYQQYLQLVETSNFSQFTQHLQQKQIDLNAYKTYLETSDIPSSETTVSLKKIQAIGIQLLNQSRISLEEINRILRRFPQIKESPRKLLHELFKERKIQGEEFLILEQEAQEIGPDPLYTLKNNGSTLEFVFTSSKNSQTLGHYQLLEELGHGGMGIVYKAYHKNLRQWFALKVLRSGENASDKMLTRFHREVKTMAKLKHPGIVQIIDSGQEGGQHYFVMEYVEGQTLEQRFQQKKLTLRESLTLLQKSLEALYYAHQQGVIHRDLKLSNILVTFEGEPKIGDFGLAKDTQEESHTLTQSGTVLGTLNYMSPEQAQGEIHKLDARSDIYSMGVCLYQLLTRTFPHQSESFSLLLRKIVHEEPLSPSAFNSAIRRDLDLIVLKSLQKSRAKRYQTAKDFANDLERFLNGYPVLAKAPSQTELFRKWGKQHRFSILFGFLMFSSLFLSLIYIQMERYTRQKNLFTERFQQAQEEEKKVLPQAESSFDQKRKNLQHLLYAFNYLNESLSIWPGEKKAELQKWDIGKQLIQLACQEESYQFAEYIQREMKELQNISSIQKEELKQWIENRKHQQSRLQKKKLDQWILYFRLSESSKEKQLEAIFEISKMKSPEVLESLQNLLKEGTDYFLHTSPPYSKAPFYFIFVSALGRIGNPKIGNELIQSLQNISSQVCKMHRSRRSVETIKFMVILTQALNHSQTLGASKTLETILWKMGENDMFWEQTERIYCRLAHRDQVDQILPKTMEEYYNRGFLKYLQKEYPEALLDASQSIQMAPNVAECYVLRGLIKEALSDYSGALKDYTDAIPLNPYKTSIYINRGTVLMHLQEFSTAHDDFSKAIQLDPACAEAYLNRGYNWHNQGNYQEALNDISQAIRINPLFEKAYVNRAVAREMLHDYAGAIEDTTIAIRMNPASEQAYLNRGNARFKNGDALGALADFQQTLYLNPHFIDGYLNRGIVKQALGDLQGAISDYTEALQIKPRADIYYTRAILKKSLGQVVEAHQDFKKYLEMTEPLTDPKTKILRNFVLRELRENPQKE